MLLGGGSSGNCNCADDSLLQPGIEYEIDVFDITSQANRLKTEFCKNKTRKKWIELTRKNVLFTRIEVDRRSLNLTKKFNILKEAQFSRIFRKWRSLRNWRVLAKKMIQNENETRQEKIAKTFLEKKRRERQQKWQNIARDLVHGRRIDSFIESSRCFREKEILGYFFNSWIQAREEKTASVSKYRKMWSQLVMDYQDFTQFESLVAAKNRVDQTRNWLYFFDEIRKLNISRHKDHMEKRVLFIEMKNSVVDQHRVQVFINAKRREEIRKKWFKFTSFVSISGARKSFEASLSLLPLMSKMKLMIRKTMLFDRQKSLLEAKRDLDNKNEAKRLIQKRNEMFQQWKLITKIGKFTKREMKKSFHGSLNIYMNGVAERSAVRIQRWFRIANERRHARWNNAKRVFEAWRGLNYKLAFNTIEFLPLCLNMKMNVDVDFSFDQLIQVPEPANIGSVLKEKKQAKKHYRYSITNAASRIIASDIQLVIPDLFGKLAITPLLQLPRISEPELFTNNEVSNIADLAVDDIDINISFEPLVNSIKNTTQHFETQEKTIIPSVKPSVARNAARKAASSIAKMLTFPFIDNHFEPILKLDMNHRKSQPKNIKSKRYIMSLIKKSIIKCCKFDFKQDISHLTAFKPEKYEPQFEIDYDLDIFTFDDFLFTFNKAFTALAPKEKPKPVFDSQFLEDATSRIVLNNDFITKTQKKQIIPITEFKHEEFICDIGDAHSGYANELNKSLTVEELVHLPVPSIQQLPRIPFPDIEIELGLDFNDLQPENITSLYCLHQYTAPSIELFVDSTISELSAPVPNLELLCPFVTEPLINLRRNELPETNLDDIINSSDFVDDEEITEAIQNQHQHVLAALSSVEKDNVEFIEMDSQRESVDFVLDNIDIDVILPAVIPQTRALNTFEHVQIEEPELCGYNLDLCDMETPELTRPLQFFVRPEMPQWQVEEIDISSMISFTPLSQTIQVFNFIPFDAFSPNNASEKNEKEAKEVAKRIIFEFKLPEFELKMPLSNLEIVKPKRVRIPKLKINYSHILRNILDDFPQTIGNLLSFNVPRIPLDDAENATYEVDFGFDDFMFNDDSKPLINMKPNERKIHKFEKEADEISGLISQEFQLPSVNFSPTIDIKPIELPKKRIPEEVVSRKFLDSVLFREFKLSSLFRPKISCLEKYLLPEIPVPDVSFINAKDIITFPELNIKNSGISQLLNFVPNTKELKKFENESEEISKRIKFNLSLPQFKQNTSLLNFEVAKVEEEKIPEYELDLSKMFADFVPKVDHLITLQHSSVPLTDADEICADFIIETLSLDDLFKPRKALSSIQPHDNKLEKNEKDADEISTMITLDLSIPPLRVPSIDVMPKSNAPKPTFVNEDFFKDDIEDFVPLNVPQLSFPPNASILNTFTKEAVKSQEPEQLDIEINLDPQRLGGFVSFTALSDFEAKQNFIDLPSVSNDIECIASSYEIEFEPIKPALRAPSVNIVTKTSVPKPTIVNERFFGEEIKVVIPLNIPKMRFTFDSSPLNNFIKERVETHDLDSLFIGIDFNQLSFIPLLPFTSLTEFEAKQSVTELPFVNTDAEVVSKSYTIELEPIIPQMPRLPFGNEPLPEPSFIDSMFEDVISHTENEDSEEESFNIEDLVDIFDDFDIKLTIKPLLNLQMHERVFFIPDDIPQISFVPLKAIVPFSNSTKPLESFENPSFTPAMPDIDFSNIIEPKIPKELEKLSISPLARLLPRKARPSTFIDQYKTSRFYVRSLNLGAPLPQNVVSNTIKPLAFVSPRVSIPLRHVDHLDEISNEISNELEIPQVFNSTRALGLFTKSEIPDVIEQYNMRRVYRPRLSLKQIRINAMRPLQNIAPKPTISTAQELADECGSCYNIDFDNSLLFNSHRNELVNFNTDSEPTNSLLLQFVSENITLQLVEHVSLPHTNALDAFTQITKPDIAPFVEKLGDFAPFESDSLPLIDPKLPLFVAPLLNFRVPELPEEYTITLDEDDIETGFLRTIKPAVKCLDSFSPELVKSFSEKEMNLLKKMQRLRLDLIDDINEMFTFEIFKPAVKELKKVAQNTDICLLTEEIEKSLDKMIEETAANAFSAHWDSMSQQQVSIVPLVAENVANDLIKKAANATNAVVSNIIKEMRCIDFIFVEKVPLQVSTKPVEKEIDANLRNSIHDIVVDSMLSVRHCIMPQRPLHVTWKLPLWFDPWKHTDRNESYEYDVSDDAEEEEYNETESQMPTYEEENNPQLNEEESYGEPFTIADLEEEEEEENQLSETIQFIDQSLTESMKRISSASLIQALSINVKNHK